MGGVEGDNGMHIPQNTGQIVCMMELSLHCNVANPSSFSCLQLSTWSRHGGVGNHDDGDGGVLVEGEVPATTGSHCGGHAAGFLVPDCVLETPGWLMCGMTWAQMAAAAPRRTNACTEHPGRCNASTFDGGACHLPATPNPKRALQRERVRRG